MIVTPKGAQIKLYSNPADMVTKKFLPEEVMDYSYDSEYNLTRVTNVDSDLSFIYDPLSRLIQTQTAGTVQPATSISYGYDVNNNLVFMTDPAGAITSYIYDNLNRLTDIKDVSNQAISHYDYDALSRRTGKSFAVSGSPFAVNYNYDIASQLLSITNLPTTISDSYTYDNVGNRLSLTDINGLHNYSYDNVYRLLNSTNPNEAYTYDPVGNRNPLTNNYDGGNRLLDDDTYTYTYDLNGNMTSKTHKVTLETTTYTYNSEDQLIGVNGNITYKYDALGRRIEKQSTVSGQQSTVKYIYDGEDIIQELDQNNQIVATYTHGPGIDEPILVEKNNQKYYYISDGLGSITALVDQNGNIAQSYRYDSFGNILSSTGSLNQPYTYTGREYDSETGLYYYRARYYDAHIGRFLQEDPIGFTGGINFYAYVRNNPLNLIDPSGLLNILVGGGGSLVGVSGVEGSGGILINPGIGDSKADAGVFVSGGIGGGLNVSGDVFAGFIFGPAQNVSGVTVNMNLSIGPLSLTLFSDSNTGNIIGGTLGAGPSGTPVGASGTVSKTGTLTIRDMIGYLKRFLNYWNAKNANRRVRRCF